MWRVWPPLTNASGPRSVLLEELQAIAQAPVGAVVTKSMTHCPRTGNPEPRLARLSNGSSLNSMGLPNLGYEAYAHLIPQIEKPVIASIAWAPCPHDLTPVEQYVTIAQAMEQAGARALELNLSCPNLEDVPIALDPESTRAVLRAVLAKVKVPVGVKLPPYNNDLRLFRQVARVLLECAPGLAYVATINSEPLTMDIDLDTCTKAIKPHHGFGGLGGPAVLPIALAEVHRFSRFFREHGSPIRVWGVGGIATPEEALKHFLAGACVVQVGTALLWHGPQVFESIWQGVCRWLAARQLTLDEIIGAVRDPA